MQPNYWGIRFDIKRMHFWLENFKQQQKIFLYSRLKAASSLELPIESQNDIWRIDNEVLKSKKK